MVVVGPSGSGKSCLWRVLRAALGKLGQTVKQYTMNPKAMPRTQVGVIIQLYLVTIIFAYLLHFYRLYSIFLRNKPLNKSSF